MKNHFLILCFLTSSFLFSQNKTAIDSLEHRLSVEKNDSVKAILLSTLFDQTIFYDVDKAKSYNDMQFDLAKKSKNNDYVYCEAYYTNGYYNAYTSNFQKAITSMKQSLFYAKKSGSSLMTTASYGRLGTLYKAISQKDSALYYIDKSIEYSKEIGDDRNFATNHFEKGNYFADENKLYDALKHYIVADSVFSKVDNKNPDLVGVLNGISIIYQGLKDYDKAENYTLRAKKIAEEIGYKERVIESIRYLAIIDFYRKDYTAAEQKYTEVLEYYVANKYPSGESQILTSLGNVHLEQDNLNQAKNYLHKALEIQRTLPVPLEMMVTVESLGRMYFKEKNYTESRKYYTEALEIARDVNFLEIEVDCLKYLAEIHYLTNNYKAAADYYRAYMPLQDSLVSRLNFEKVAELETRYQTAKKEQQIELLSAENQLGKQKRKNQFTIFASLVGLLLIVGLAFAFAYRNKRKTSRKIRELNQMKSRFFANISHEFRTPLTLIKSPLQNLQAEISDENQQKQLSLIDRNSDRMLELVNQLLELSKIDSSKLILLLKAGNIGLFLKSITEPFAYRAEENGLKFSSAIEDTEATYRYDKDVIEKIVTNLLSNAVKYTPENHEIRCSSTIENNTLKINVSNSGTQLKNKDLPKLFERFHQNDRQNEGFGIGLALVKELVDLYQGNIETSVADGVLSFAISLPLTKNEAESIVIQNTAENIETVSSSETEHDSEHPVLLIVDDNAEMRSVLKTLFSEHYTILEAAGGVSALQLAQKEIPDCIVSDVMMPEMDGFEFTRNIKDNELTSFIPVLLLTAKTSDEARLESLKNEADAFLTKPFNNDILKETVHHLIAERKKLQERYSRELVLKPFEVAVNSPDERFLEKVSEIVHNHLSDSGFTVETFADKTGLSRMQLHRKLKSLLGVSARELIRNERLNHAAVMLREGKYTISEVGYAIGFDDLSYFSKSFKEKFNCTPSEFMGK